MNKYEELYRLAKDLAEQAEARFDTIDGKATSYLSVLTLLVGVAAFFLKWITDTLIPPAGVFEWLLCILGIGITASVIVSWWLVFRVLRIHRVWILPLSDEMIEFFTKHQETDLRFALARRYRHIWAANQAVNEAKTRDLAAGYRAIIFTGVILIFFATLYVAYTWTG